MLKHQIDLGSALRGGGTRRRTTLALLLTVTLGACSAPGSGSTPDAGQASPTAVSTDVSGEQVELTLYDGAGLKAIDEALIEAFTAKHPNITITGRYDPDDVQAQNAPRVLSSEDPPDIARIIALSDVVQDGQLTNLDAYAEAYGWDQLPEGQLAQYRVSEDGVRGSGSQYAMADGFTVTGFYYNKQLAQQLGMTTPPATVADFEAVLAKAKAAGIVPIMAGNQTGQVVFALQMMLNNTLGAEAVNDWVFHVPDASIGTPEAVQAVEKVAGWAEAGYFPADTNGTDATAAAGRFARGEALFYVSGNWDAATLDKSMAGNVGFMLPPTDEPGQAAAMSDPASNFGIPVGSDDKDAAAAFLDFLRSPEARQVVVDAGFAPSGSGEIPQVTPGSANAAVQEAFARLVETDGQVQFVQNATNGVTSVWNAEAQKLVAGQSDAARLLQAVQAQYEDELGR
ncbi:ABC transporter substrate-binding protein [Kineococcus arenarius]|uniref:ABC transporter substrate-binding protein n=1 Tax=Kineococcus sp. SYSU DK007 TaxID=3383128 RepID=UPI003D7DCA07